MSFRSTAILLAVLLALCAAFWGIKKAGERKVRRVAEARRLFDFGPEALRSITVDRINEEPTAAVQFEPGKWRITEPDTEIRASNEVWGRLAENLAGLVNEHPLLDSVDDPAMYGLAEPILEVRAETEAGESFSLRFGGLEPTRTLRYAQQDGAGLFLVNKDQFHELNRERALLRHQFLIDDREGNLLRVELAHFWNGDEGAPGAEGRAIGDESNPLILVRDSTDAPWRMIAPIEAAADQEKAEALANEIRGGRASNFIDAPEHLSDYGLAPPRIRITVVDDLKGERQTLYLGGLDKRTSGIFAKHEKRPAVFVIEPHITLLIPKKPLDIRERRMLTRPVGEAVNIEYHHGTTHLTFTNDPERGWGVSAPPLEDAEQGIISIFISALIAVEAAEFVEGPPEDYGLDEPTISVRITHAAAEDSMTARFRYVPGGEDGEDRWYAVQQDSGDVMRVDPRYAQTLIVDATDFRSRRMLTFNRSEAVLLDLTFEEKAYRFEKAHGQWMVRLPENWQLDNQSDVERILEIFSKLEATDIEKTDSGDDTRYGLAPETLRFEVTTRADGGEDLSHGPLRVGGMAGVSLTERYARTAGREGVFRVHQDVVTAVRYALEGVREAADGIN